MSVVKLNLLRIIMAEKEKTDLWLGIIIGKNICTVSKCMNQRVQSNMRTLYDIDNALDVDV
jgi:hypothetical protein